MTSRRTFKSLTVIAIMVLMLSPVCGLAAEPDSKRVAVRIGWQIPAATQGQITQVLKRTDVLEKRGLNPTFVPYSFGTPQVEAALAGKLDVIFSGDQPAINMITQGGNWKIAARLTYDRVALMVPKNSPIKEIKDLRGKTVASPFGSIAHREAVMWEQAAGLDSERDVRNVDMDILDIRKLVTAGGGEKWGEIDAVAVWEPSTSYFELDQLARKLDTTPTLWVVSISENFISRHPHATVELLVAIIQARSYFSQHPDRVRQWYLDDSQLGYTLESIISAARVDPNLGIESPANIDLRLSESDLATLEQGATWKQEQDDSGVVTPILTAVDQGMLAEAMEKLTTSELKNIEVIMPSAREARWGGEKSNYLLDLIPPWAFFIGMVLLTLLSIEFGQWLGTRRRERIGEEPEAAISTLVGAVLALLAFVIALTFGAAISRFDAGREALLEDVTSLRTAHQRAGLVSEPHQTETRLLLRDYIEVRIGMAELYGNPDQLLALQARAKTLQDLLWSQAEALAAKDANDINALFSEGLTDVFKMQTRRVAYGAQFRIPIFVWFVVILVACISMVVVGLQFGVSGRRSSLAQLGLSMAFALIIQLIYDLDRPGQGVIALNQQPMIELFQSLGTQKQ